MILLFAAAFAASWAGVALFRRWSLRRNLLDVPNERSSHSVPTPRGGGLVIAIASLLGYAIIASLFDIPFSWGYFAGAIVIAGISWLDDLYSLPFWSRLIVHIGASFILILDVGLWDELFIPILSVNIPLGGILGGLFKIGRAHV